MGKENWEIYAEVVRKIYSELGNLEESNFELREEKKYNIAMKYGVYNADMDYFELHYIYKENKLKEKLD